ncbi:hypothetical protein NDU88_002152 [Pleurodeles waltl]|uniref:Uncharacterized protein n=1 Tax=Pleurodeles waltl TaxID=8319 RepID=A0AAV7M557_PLEWA|nr:hypothetical protein NDU88_002152 [Pleurodeles waltl]
MEGSKGKVFNDKKTFAGDAGQIWSPKQLVKERYPEQYKECQLDAERDYIDEELVNDNDLDEYVLDLEYKDGFEDELGGNLTTKNSEDLLDSLGEKLFEPKDVRHLRGKEWWPLDYVASYIKAKLRKPLEKDERNVMRVECSRLVIDVKVCLTPNLDPEMITYLFKLGRDPRKGLEKSLK